MFQYITAASSLTNSTIESFDISGGTSAFIESTTKNFFFVRENGLFVLRDGNYYFFFNKKKKKNYFFIYKFSVIYSGSEFLADQFFQFYNSITDDF
jgi:hypothetical protein